MITITYGMMIGIPQHHRKRGGEHSREGDSEYERLREVPPRRQAKSSPFLQLLRIIEVFQLLAASSFFYFFVCVTT